MAILEQCGDNRFEIIAKAKEELIANTNIESSPEEMAVLNNILFRMWQMGWLPSQKWHKVSHRLPKDKVFLARKKDRPQIFAVLEYSRMQDGFWNIPTGGFMANDDALEYYSHWMEIPEIMED